MSKKSPQVDGGNGERQRILIADDDPVTLRALGHHLSAAGYEIVTAEDGREAQRRAAQEPARQARNGQGGGHLEQGDRGREDAGREDVLVRISQAKSGKFQITNSKSLMIGC